MKESVHTVEDYHDGPIVGVAEFAGKPHYYKCEFDEEADKYGDIVRLLPIPKTIFEAAMEKWQIWCRWRKAFDAGM